MAEESRWDDLLNTSIEEVVVGISQHEAEWGPEKLATKLREYSIKASKSLDFRQDGVKVLVKGYISSLMGSLIAGLGDREWFNAGRADLLPVVDAGIKIFFPRWTLQSMDQLEFEALVLHTYDRCFEEERFTPLLTEAVPNVVQGAKIKKKVWSSLESGRKDALDTNTEDVEEFVRNWITSSIGHLGEHSCSKPEYSMTPEDAVKLFVLLIEGGGIPLSLQGAGVESLSIVETAVAAAYGPEACGGEAEAEAEAKRPRLGA